MNTRLVREAVATFRAREGYGEQDADCFAPWYLQHRFHLSEEEACRQSSDGSFDFGIDAFHITRDDAGVARELYLVQAKFTEHESHIRRGFKNLEAALPVLAQCLEGAEIHEPQQNKVLVNLRGALNGIPHEVRQRLKIYLEVVHLWDADDDLIAVRLSRPCERLREVANETLGSHAVIVRHVGPRHLKTNEFVSVPPERSRLRFDGVRWFPSENSENGFYLGVGRLADLVELYQARRDHLFARNVRYYIYSRKNTETGPAAKMRATLRRICVEEKEPPERFAMFHNGITVCANRVDVGENEVYLTEPYVLNGCQTIKTAFLFRTDKHVKVKEDRWQAVGLPVRIIQTKSDDLIQAITISNNRQNPIGIAALRANDRVQIELEQRFASRGIFYERQEGAFKTLRNAQPEVMAERYARTGSSCIEMQRLARAIMAAAGEVTFAVRPSELFESDAAYGRCFDPKDRLRSVVFLTFLYNLHENLGKVLEQFGGSLEKKRSNWSYEVYCGLCLVARWLAKKQAEDFVADWGQQVWRRSEGLKTALKELLGRGRRSIGEVLRRQFSGIESGGADKLRGAFEACKRELGLGDDIKPFAVFARLDDKVDAGGDFEGTDGWGRV
ncbi:MAG: AIPR family protein [Myxococcota bacterium]|nr:AIPR family protein [Myxococcota bacterium]MDW8363495.1 AIPR family protein [Myxococcales bacterium]